MAIDTLAKRAAALRYGIGRTRQPEGESSKFNRAAGLGLYAIITTVIDGITTRLTLIGTSKERYTIQATSQERLTVRGTSQERIDLEGSSR